MANQKAHTGQASKAVSSPESIRPQQATGGDGRQARAPEQSLAPDRPLPAAQASGTGDVRRSLAVQTEPAQGASVGPGLLGDTSEWTPPAHQQVEGPAVGPRGDGGLPSLSTPHHISRPASGAAMQPATPSKARETATEKPKTTVGEQPQRLRAAGVRVRRQEIDFAVLEDGSLAELVEDPAEPGRRRLLVWKDGQATYPDEVRDGARLLVPISSRSEVLRRIRLPRGVQPYPSTRELLAELDDLIGQCVVLDWSFVAVLSSFVLSTWLGDRLPVAPYVSLVGMPQSGKTTLLKVLSLLCRRSLLTADISSAAFYEACTRLTPTLLIDEGGTHASNRHLRHLLRVGTTRDVVGVRKNRVVHVYGPKVVAFLEAPDDPALNSRCILVPMMEANADGLLKVTDPVLEERARILQRQLLQFRLQNYKHAKPAPLPGAESLRPRTKDLLTCLATAAAEDTKRVDDLVHFFKYQNKTLQEPLPPAEDAVLAALFYLVHFRREYSNFSGKSLGVSDVTCLVNDVLDKSKTRVRVKPRKVGAILTSLGFLRRERTNKGWTLWLDETDVARLHELVKVHGLDGLASQLLEVPPQKCGKCRELGIAKG